MANLDGIPLFEKNWLASNWISETCGTQEQFIYAHMENDFCPKNIEANHSPMRPTMVFCYQNCSSDQEKKLKFEAENLKKNWDH